MEKGHTYLVAIKHWHSRAVLAWEISNTMDSAFCVRALKEALRRTGRKPKIFNTARGSQFTGKEWISELQKQGIQISMDGQGLHRVAVEELEIRKATFVELSDHSRTSSPHRRLDRVLQSPPEASNAWLQHALVNLPTADQPSRLTGPGGVAGEAPFRVFRYAPASPFHLTRYEPKPTQQSRSLRTS
jgi:transposase InsO family protein